MLSNIKSKKSKSTWRQIGWFILLYCASLGIIWGFITTARFLLGLPV